MASATGRQKQHLLIEQPLAQSIVVKSLLAMMRSGFVYPGFFRVAPASFTSADAAAFGNGDSKTISVSSVMLLQFLPP
jgi:hypothetical protein